MTWAVHCALPLTSWLHSNHFDLQALFHPLVHFNSTQGNSPTPQVRICGNNNSFLCCKRLSGSCFQYLFCGQAVLKLSRCFEVLFTNSYYKGGLQHGHLLAMNWFVLICEDSERNCSIKPRLIPCWLLLLRCSVQD